MSRPALALLAFWGVIGGLAIGVGLWLALARPHPASSPKPAATMPGTAMPTASPQPSPKATQSSAAGVRAAGAQAAGARAAAAGPADPAPVVAANPRHWPQVGLLVGGFGLAAAISDEAVAALPAPVAFAVSPYAHAPQALVDRARSRGHEVLLSLAMEPEGAPRDDEGDRQLSLALDEAQRRQRLQEMLDLFTGYDGVTNAEAGQYGAHFAASAGFAEVGREIDRRGLLYVTTIAPLVPVVRMLVADLVVDDPPDAVDIDARLSRLEALAETNGCALGVTGPLTPMLLDRLRVWTNALPARGLALESPRAMAPDGAAPCPAAGHPPPRAEPAPP